MNTPKFYIYGVPDGFDMLSGTLEEIPYFQLFYDTSKKGTDFRINRKPNGDVVYSYLKYNLVSSAGRIGAFLGMSVVFTDKQFCTEPIKLRDLLDGVYTEVILKANDEDKIISSNNVGNTNGSFCISKFSNKRRMCEKIGRIIIHNINAEFNYCISTIDNTFENNKGGVALCLPFDSDKEIVNNALRKYSWISLSTECIPPQDTDDEDTEYVDEHTQNQWMNNILLYQDKIIQIYNAQLQNYDFENDKTEILKIIDSCNRLEHNQPELKNIKDKYIDIYEEIKRLESSINRNKRPVQQTENLKNNFLDTIKSHLVELLISCVVLLLILGAVSLYNINKRMDDKMELSRKSKERELKNNLENNISISNDEEKTTADAISEFDLDKFNQFLKNENFEEAIKMVEDFNGDKKTLFYKFQNSFCEWFNKKLENGKDNIEILNKLNGYINKYKQYLDVDSTNLTNLINNAFNNISRKGNVEKINTKLTIYKSDTEGKKGVKIQNEETIECKKYSNYIIETNNTIFPELSNGIDLVKNKEGFYHIKLTKFGKQQLKFDNQTIITFNVQMNE